MTGWRACGTVGHRCPTVRQRVQRATVGVACRVHRAFCSRSEPPDPDGRCSSGWASPSASSWSSPLLAWIGRDGYSDADGSPLSLLDAIYYSTVTVTTTGYGDIAPISPGARAVTAFVVTPLRVVFLVVLVGTTLELLTERFRHARAEARWRRTVRDHTIVAGYGTMGRRAVETLLANGTTTVDQVVVIDSAGVGVDERQGSRA